MHGRHCGLAESDTPADDFDDRRDAVRRAARARDDVLCAARYVGTVDERLDIHVLGWGGEENEASASSDVLLEVLAPRERSRALEYEVDAEVLPGQFQRLAFAEGQQCPAMTKSPLSTATDFE